MKSCVFFFLCILLAFVSSQDAVAGHKLRSLTKKQTTPPSRATTPKSSVNGKVPTSYPTHRSHRDSAISSPTRNEKMPPSHTRVPKSSGKVPIPTILTFSAKKSVRPTIGITSHQKPKVTNSSGTPTLVSASKTLTVSDGQTASAQVGWIVVGTGVGGSVVVGGNILPVAGGTEVIIVENSSGQDEASTISESDLDTSTSLTSRSTSSSSSSTSSVASPTSYNIYPKLDSTPPQQSAFARNLEQIAQPGSVRQITGGRDQLLLWVASLTPAQASELSRNPVVSPLMPYLAIVILCNVLIRSGVLMWISHYGLIWKVQVALTCHQTVLPRTALFESVMELFCCREMRVTN